MIRLIGLAGPAQCGKSSFAGFLNEKLPLIPYSLASPIKALICTLFGWDERHREGVLKETIVEVGPNPQAFFEEWERLRMEEILQVEMTREEYVKLIHLLFQDETANDGPFISPRRAFQLFGTEYARGILPTVWLDMARRELDECSEDTGLIIPDVRFPNEHQWVSHNGGVVVHIRRTGQRNRIKETEHKSEAGLKHMAMDWVIPECESLEQLEVQADKFVGFAKFATTSDVAISSRMPTFNDMYGEISYGG